jgi:hypothetical protein
MRIYAHIWFLSRLQICPMVHRGEILKAAIKQSGIPVTRVAAGVGKSRRWVYMQFFNPEVAIDALLQIGKFIHHDFSKEIPELKHNNSISKLIREQDAPYPQTDAEFWKNKYLRLLEEYTAHLKKSRATEQ